MHVFDGVGDEVVIYVKSLDIIATYRDVPALNSLADAFVVSDI